MPNTLQREIRLSIRGLGEITSFKNTKKIIRLPDGTPSLTTDPKKAAKMEAYTRSIESQLRSMLPTIASEMALGCQNPLPMLSLLQLGRLLPLDDSRQWIPKFSFDFKQVPKGMEGCDILIEQLP